jgi:hypothetical protein
MKFMNVVRLMFLSVVVCAGARVLQAADQTATNENVIIPINLDRKVVVAENMQLTDEEGKVFWPLYREYRVAMDQINDGLIKFVKEYTDAYPNITEERAGKILCEYIALEKKLMEARAVYLKKISKTLSAVKTLRLAQVENRLDLVVRLQIAGTVPLASNQGK